jgi:hypothetical protein
MLADMKDSKNNKTNNEAISELSVRAYGDTAIATYKSTYDSLYHGDRTILSARHVCPAERFVETSGKPQFRTREIGFYGYVFVLCPSSGIRAGGFYWKNYGGVEPRSLLWQMCRSGAGRSAQSSVLRG